MLTELCSSYSLCSDFTVCSHVVIPAEFLLSHLETRLSEYVKWTSVCLDKSGRCDGSWKWKKCQMTKENQSDYCQKYADDWHGCQLALWEHRLVLLIMFRLPEQKCSVDKYTAFVLPYVRQNLLIDDLYKFCSAAITSEILKAKHQIVITLFSKL